MKDKNLVQLEEVKLDELTIIEEGNAPIFVGGGCGIICGGVACGGTCGGVACAGW